MTRSLGIRLARYVGIALLVLLVAYGLLRGVIAERMVAKLSDRLGRSGLTLRTGAVEPQGLLGFRTDSLVVKRGRDTVAYVGRLALQVRVGALLLGRVEPEYIEVVEALIRWDEAVSAPLDTANRTRAISPSKGPQFAGKLTGLWRRIAPLLSAHVVLEKVDVAVAIAGQPKQREWLHIGMDTVRWGAASAEGHFTANGQAWLLSQAGDTLVLESAKAQLLPLPVLTEKLGLKLGAKRIAVSRAQVEGSEDEAEVKIAFSAEGLMLLHRRISNSPVVLNNLTVALKGRCTPAQVHLDSSTVIGVNGLDWRAYADVRLDLAREGSERPDSTIHLRLKGPDTLAQRYLDAFAATGAFGSLRGMQADGRWRYQASLDFDSRRPDTLAFVSNMGSRGFRIRRYGVVRLSAVADTFTHVPPGTRLRRKIGPTNPDYSPISQTSTYVVDAILTSEDPSFRWHRGFSEAAIGESILQNYRQGRFARGGSTLSMQLVKNVFLSPEKTLARKLEESLLVWMIEDQRVLTKDRMLEVYLNVIEWGPDVYGLTQAARFYFGKAPEALDVTEAVFLAIVIPRPRKFYYHFDAEGNQRPHLAKAIELIAGLMARRGLITTEQAELASVLPVRLSAQAVEYVKKTTRKPGEVPTEELLMDLDLLDEEDDSIVAPDSTGGY